MRRVLSLIAEPDYDILDRIMESVVDDELWLKKREKAVAILEEYHQNGARIIIISAAYEPAVQKFAARIGGRNTLGIGTPVHLTEAGLELAEVLNSREVKLERLREMIGDQQIDVALGDTFADIPLLEEAVEPVAVFPDRLLRDTAVKRGWMIVE